MIYTYDELIMKKDSGENLDFNKITKEQLEELFIYENISNSMIANLYNVSDEKVKNKRYKWNIKLNCPKYLYANFVKDNKELFDDLNKKSKERLLKEENISWLSKALTHYLFRNGPVEDMHASNKLSQEDMKKLNKFMVNRIAGLLKLINDNEWLKIDLLFNTFVYKYSGSDWDEPEYDMEEVDYVFYNSFINKK